MQYILLCCQLRSRYKLCIQILWQINEWIGIRGAPSYYIILEVEQNCTIDSLQVGEMKANKECCGLAELNTANEQNSIIPSFLRYQFEIKSKVVKLANSHWQSFNRPSCHCLTHYYVIHLTLKHNVGNRIKSAPNKLVCPLCMSAITITK